MRQALPCSSSKYRIEKTTEHSGGGLLSKKLCTVFDNRHRSGNGVGDSSKVSPWHTPTPV